MYMTSSLTSSQSARKGLLLSRPIPAAFNGDGVRLIFLAEFFILKFLRLEVMFGGAPVNVIFVKPVAGEVG